MAVFVGSNSDDSRIRSNRVGFAASTANPDSPSEGDAYYNSGDGKLNVYDGSSWNALGGNAGSLSGTVSGTLSDGQAVIVKSDGNLAGVVTSEVGIATGSRVVFTGTNRPEYISSVFDPDTNQIVMCYKDKDDNNRIKAIVGRISSGSLTGLGTASYVYPTASGGGYQGEYTWMTYDPEVRRVAILFKMGTGTYSNAGVQSGKIVGNSIVFEQRAGVRELGRNGSTWCRSVYIPDQKCHVGIFYSVSETKGVGCVYKLIEGGGGFLRDRDPEGGAVRYKFSTGEVSHTGLCYDSENKRIVVSYRDHADSNKGKVVVGTVDADTFSISFGTPVLLNNQSTEHTTAVYDPISKRVVISYRNAGLSGYGEAATAVVDPSDNSITVGNSRYIDGTGSGSTADFLSSIYDPISKRVITFYADNDDNLHGYVSVGTVIPHATNVMLDTMTFTKHKVNDNRNYGSQNGLSLTVDTTQKKVCLVSEDYGTSNEYGSVRTFNPTYAGSNLEEHNFLGFSAGAYTNGQTASVQIEGTIDDAQSGLTTGTKHYVQDDGSLSVTKGFPVVEAGTALSATEIAVKG
tara:strand:- start:11 stop:1729 length:1719 start_codon:yes stop_codon:yes gene_type:complete